jgi:hypothetical protein
VIHLDLPAYKSPAHAVPIGELFLGLFRFVSKHGVSVVSIHVLNTEANQNKPKEIFFGFVKQTEKNQNRLSFGSFRFKPKIFFGCIEDSGIPQPLFRG